MTPKMVTEGWKPVVIQVMNPQVANDASGWCANSTEAHHSPPTEKLECAFCNLEGGWASNI